jgi:energy-coupling factor transporter ATP-binding protein EcfA2
MVAPNGAGKSTLLRLLAGEFEPEAGFINFRGGAALGYYRQSHETKPEGDVLSALLSGFGEITTLRTQLAEAQELAATGSTHALGRLAALSDQYQIARGDELEHKVAAIATKLGFLDLTRVAWFGVHHVAAPSACAHFGRPWQSGSPRIIAARALHVCTLGRAWTFSLWVQIFKFAFTVKTRVL